MDVIVTDCLPVFSSQRYIPIYVYDSLGVANTPYDSWFFGTIRNIANPGHINMYIGDKRNGHLYNYTEYQGTIAHEFGHTLLLGDAYFKNDRFGGTLISNPEVVTDGTFGIDGCIMYCNGQVCANDIEMVLEAFVSNNPQDYYTLPSNSEHTDLMKSNVIRLKQVFHKS